MARPLFLTGLARGGTNLLARMLIAGGASQIAIHAFLPWFKSLRNALVLRHGTPELLQWFDPESPFGDGHFDDRDNRVQGILHGATIDVSFLEREWPDLLPRLQSRASHDAAHLCPGFATLAGETGYREMMDRILALVLQGHDAGTEFVGLIDTWIVDLLPALARTYPDACFVVVIRDPRAIIASTLKFLETSPDQVGCPLSIMRQWRKFVALSYEFQRAPLFAGRLQLVRYEDQVAEPAMFARRLCEFLDLPYNPAMIDFAAYVDQSRHQAWSGNSAFEARLHGIDSGPVERWRKTLEPNALAAIEFCCSADMNVCGYTLAGAIRQDAAESATRAYLADISARDWAWRTDTRDAEVEFGRELLRGSLASNSTNEPDSQIRKAFLSPAYFDLIRSRGTLFPPL